MPSFSSWIGSQSIQFIVSSRSVDVHDIGKVIFIFYFYIYISLISEQKPLDYL